MNSIFWELLHEGVLANYMDDFVIPAKTDSLLFEDSRKTQFMFQKIEMQFQHRRNPNSRSSSWKRTSANGNR